MCACGIYIILIIDLLYHCCICVYLHSVRFFCPHAAYARQVAVTAKHAKRESINLDTSNQVSSLCHLVPNMYTKLFQTISYKHVSKTGAIVSRVSS